MIKVETSIDAHLATIICPFDDFCNARPWSRIWLSGESLALTLGEHMKSLTAFIILFGTTMIVTTACGGSSGSSGYPPGSNSVASYLVDGSGRTMYEYSGDVANSGVSNCTTTNGCYAAWPEVPAGESIAATSGSPQTGLISSFTRSNPSGSQATYAGKPLYYFVSDTSPGMVNGNGVSGFSVVSP